MRKIHQATVAVERPDQLEELVRLAANADIGLTINETDILSTIREEFPAVAEDIDSGTPLPTIRERAAEMFDGEEHVRLVVLLDDLEDLIQTGSLDDLQ